MMDERPSADGLTLLTRLARAEPEKRSLAETGHRADMERLAFIVIDVAQETGDPIRRLLADTLARAGRLGSNDSIRMPTAVSGRTVALPGAILTLLERRLRGACRDGRLWLVSSLLNR